MQKTQNANEPCKTTLNDAIMTSQDAIQATDLYTNAMPGNAQECQECQAI